MSPADIVEHLKELLVEKERERDDEKDSIRDLIDRTRKIHALEDVIAGLEASGAGFKQNRGIQEEFLAQLTRIANALESPLLPSTAHIPNKPLKLPNPFPATVDSGYEDSVCLLDSNGAVTNTISRRDGGWFVDE